MMSDSNYVAEYCEGCGELCRVHATAADALGGSYYCGDCEAPEGHPQHPDTDFRP